MKTRYWSLPLLAGLMLLTMAAVKLPDDPPPFLRKVHSVVIQAMFAMLPNGSGPGMATSTVPTFCSTFAGEMTGNYFCKDSSGTVGPVTLSATGSPASQTDEMCPNGLNCTTITGVRTGTGQYFSTPNMASPSADFSACALFSADSVAGGGALISKWNPSSSFTLETSTTTLLSGVHNGAAQTAITGGVINPGEVHLACVTYDFVANNTSIERLYLDGTEMSNSTTAVGPAVALSGAPIGVGHRSDGTTPFGGRIYTAFLTEKVLTPTTVAAMASSLLPSLTGTSGQAITDTRASVRSCINDTGGSILPANKACVTTYTTPGVTTPGSGGVTNLLLWSDQFQQTPTWESFGSVSVTTNNVTDPASGTLADTLTSGTTDSNLAQSPTLSAGNTYTASIWLKVPSGTQSILVRFLDNGGAHSAGGNQTITTTWQRFTFTISGVAAGAGTFQIGGASTWGSGVVLHAYGAQVEQSATANSYCQSTGTQGVCGGSGPTYTPGTTSISGLYVSGAVTNLLARSSEAGVAPWNVQNSPVVTANVALDPFGAMTADDVTSGAGGGSVAIDQPLSGVAATDTGTYTCSVWVKANTASSLDFGIYDLDWAGLSCSVLSGQGIVTGGSGVPCSLASLSTSTWTRVSATRAMINNAQVPLFYIYPSSSGATTAGVSVRIAGAQCNAGTVALPYFPTAAASASSSADSVSVATNATWPVGTGDITVHYTPLNMTGTPVLVDTQNGTSGWRFYIDFPTNTVTFSPEAATVATYCGSSALTWNYGQTYKLRASWSGGNVTVYRDDVQVASCASMAVPTAITNPAYIGSLGGVSNFATGLITVDVLSPTVIAGGGGGGGSALYATVMGMNNGSPETDYDPSRIYADAVKSSRDFMDFSTGSTAAPLDAAGWPNSDFQFYVWGNLDHSQGTYALSFNGKANVHVNGPSSYTLSGVSYNSGTNTSSYTLTINDTSAINLNLGLDSTQKTGSGSTNTGVSNISLMRPSSVGSGTPFAAGTLFNPLTFANHQRFAVIRYMGYLGTNFNQQVNWSDRAKPGDPSQQRFANASGYGFTGRGVCWEHVILMANTLNRDAYINIPVGATDAYITNVANLFKYGSDGTNPYTSTQASPVYPPLNSGLKLYVEWSNEVWNGQFSQFTTNQNAAATEVGAGGSPLKFDGETNTVYWGWRRVAKRSKEMSDLFRAVWGDAAMMTTVRPILAAQEGNGQNTFAQEMKILQGYYNNGEGSFVGTPHPPNYYFYGGGGSAYYYPDNNSDTLTLTNFWTSNDMDVNYWKPTVKTDADIAAGLGIKRIAYEGGPSFDNTGHSESVKAAAWADPRMRQAFKDHQTLWTSMGGNLLMYLGMYGGYSWGFTQDPFSSEGQKDLGVDDLSPLTMTAVTNGVAIPNTITGKEWVINSQTFGSPSTGSQAFAPPATNGSNPFCWASYTFNAATSGSRTVTLTITGATAGAQVGVYVDGALQSFKTLGAGGSTQTWTLTMSAGVHGIIVADLTQPFTLTSIGVS